MEITYEYGFDKKSRTLYIRKADKDKPDKSGEDSLELTMLLTCRIPGLLPVRRSFFNNRTIYAYDCRGALSQAEKPPEKEDIYRIGRAIFSAERMLEDHMISPRHLILDPDLVYFRENGEILFACVPFSSRNFQQGTADYLESLRTNEEYGEEERLYLGRFIRLLREGHHTLDEIEEILTRENRSFRSTVSITEPKEGEEIFFSEQGGYVPAGIKADKGPEEDKDEPEGMTFGRKLLIRTLVFCGLTALIFFLLGCGFLRGSFFQVLFEAVGRGLGKLRSLAGENALPFVLLAGAGIGAAVYGIKRFRSRERENGTDGKREKKSSDRGADGRKRFLIGKREHRENTKEEVYEAAFPESDPERREQLLRPVQELSASSPRRAFFISGEGGKRILLRRDSVLIGRDKERADIFIDDEGIEPRHAVIEKNSGEYFISDLNTRGGTFLNGLRMMSGRLWQLADGDEITLDGRTYFFRLEDGREN